MVLYRFCPCKLCWCYGRNFYKMDWCSRTACCHHGSAHLRIGTDIIRIFMDGMIGLMLLVLQHIIADGLVTGD